MLEPDKSPEALVGVLARTGATILVGVSTYDTRLACVIVAGKLAFPALRMTLCGGELLLRRSSGHGARRRDWCLSSLGMPSSCTSCLASATASTGRSQR